MNSEEVIELFDKKEWLNWIMEYIQDGELRTTAYRSKTIKEAIDWLTEITNKKARIISCYSSVLDEIDEDD